MKYDYLVFIGRFQPFHSGHYHVVKESLKISKNLIVVVGSHDASRDSRNPFTTMERVEIIQSALTDDELDRIHIAPQYDHHYNEEKWIVGIQASVNAITHNKFNPDPIKIGIIGYNKDHSSYYLKKFPTWDIVDVAPIHPILNATDLRNILFGKERQNFNDYVVTADHYNAIMKHSYKSSVYNLISKEMEHITSYKKGWESAPYAPTFVTVDAVVTQSGHVLVVERGAMPGEGLLAMPGGFVNQYESLKDAVIRELYEETKIDVPIPVLIGSIASQRIFDYPYRSLRGRTITEAYHFKLSDREYLPKIKGSDDARNARWISFNDFYFSRSMFFEDHFQIIESMLGL